MVHCCFGARHVLPATLHYPRFRPYFGHLSGPTPTTAPNPRLPNHHRNNQRRCRGSQHSQRYSKSLKTVQSQPHTACTRTHNTRNPSTPSRFTNIMGHFHRWIKCIKWVSPHNCATKSSDRPQLKSRKTLPNKIRSRTFASR